MEEQERIGELLIQHRIIDQDQLRRALEIQRYRYQPIGSIFIQQGIITEEQLMQILAIQAGVSAWNLRRDPPTMDALRLIAESDCRDRAILPVQVRGDRLVLAMTHPDDIETIEAVRELTKLRVEPVLVSEISLERAITDAFSGRQMSDTGMDKLVSQAMIEVDGDDSPGGAKLPDDISESEMRPAVSLFNQILAEAIRFGASDIHIEPRAERTDIRYRIDGQLVPMRDIPSALHRVLVARVKIMSHLDIVEYRVPQDGRIGVKVDGRVVDIRVSILPNYHGSRVVLRILDKSIALRSMEELGFDPHNLTLFNSIVTKPYGLFLVTGPTGSGKTTTLYAALNQLKQVTNNIMTCEDPVEYDIDGINQSHVNEKVGLTFAMQLRAILRQDPDIVLVGEIRDKETAETAIRAALTGHMVLSTLHCNDAPNAVARLTDMGVDPFLLSSSLVGVMAQRLVRVLCPSCRQQVPATDEDQALIQAVTREHVSHVWQSVGCHACHNMGFRGRMGVHEVMPAPPSIQAMISTRPSGDDLRRAAERYGYQPMQVDAVQRALAGQTTLAEVRRQVYFDTFAETYPRMGVLEAA